MLSALGDGKPFILFKNHELHLCRWFLCHPGSGSYHVSSAILRLCWSRRFSPWLDRRGVHPEPRVSLGGQKGQEWKGIMTFYIIVITLYHKYVYSLSSRTPVIMLTYLLSYVNKNDACMIWAVGMTTFQICPSQPQGRSLHVRSRSQMSQLCLLGLVGKEQMPTHRPSDYLGEVETWVTCWEEGTCGSFTSEAAWCCLGPSLGLGERWPRPGAITTSWAAAAL